MKNVQSVFSTIPNPNQFHPLSFHCSSFACCRTNNIFTSRVFVRKTCPIYKRQLFLKSDLHGFLVLGSGNQIEIGKLFILILHGICFLPCCPEVHHQVPVPDRKRPPPELLPSLRILRHLARRNISPEFWQPSL